MTRTGKYFASIAFVSTLAMLGMIASIFMNPPKDFAHIKA